MRARSSLLRLAALALTAGAMLGGAACSLVAGLDKLEFTDAAVCADACDDEDPCTENDCRIEGVCHGTPLPDGPAPSDLKGDCQHVTCAGGTAQTSIDNDDVPADDGSSCTDERCDQGKATHAAHPDGAACARPGPIEVGVCEAGACLVPCSDDAICDDQNPCTTDACDLDKKVCRNTALDAIPTPGSIAVVGDCRARRCVSGVDTDVADDTDVVANVNECSLASCDQGAPVTTAAPLGAKCSFGGGQVCNGAQACVACNVAADCTSEDECHLPVCNPNKTCGTTPAPKGTKLKNFPQIDGDCHSFYCNENGGTTNDVDTDDKPDDGNPCTVDTCTMTGAPSHVPAVPAGGDCGVGQKCTAAGKCGCANDMQCMAPDTCGGGNPGTMFTCGCTKKSCATLNATCGQVSDGCYATQSCNSGTKNGNETDVDCGGGGGCATKCALSKQCKVAADCASGFCADGVCCNTACSGVCAACNLTGLVGTCSNVPSGSPDAVTCLAPNACDGLGACKKPTAALCASGSDCQSGACSDGVCCNSACKNVCKACNIVGFVGTCSNVAKGQHDSTPVGNCAAPMACDGAATCKLGTGQPCTVATDCASGVCTNLVCQ